MQGIKRHPNRRIYIEALRSMTPEQRLLKALELTDEARELTRAGIRAQFPAADDRAVEGMLVERILRCHKRSC